MFTFPLNPIDIFHERSIQFRAWGIPDAIIPNARTKITDCWVDGPGGWCFEWEQHGKCAESAGKWLLAAACYGAAKFPCPVTPAMQHAYQQQIRCYEKASSKFPCQFERKIITVPYRHEFVDIPTHIFRPRNGKSNGVVCLSGGVDTLKMELHRLALALAVLGDFTVVAMDMPGTGESPVPLAFDAEKIYLEILKHFQATTNPGEKTAVIALSFGAMWAAKLAMLEAVDAAINIGGPVCATPLDSDFLHRLPNGMLGIIANALRLDSMPSDLACAEILSQFTPELTSLLLRKKCSPMLVFNGSRDPYIAREDSEVFRDFDNAKVWIFKNATHCAPEIFVRVVPAMIGWLQVQLQGKSWKSSTLSGLGKVILPSMV